MPFQRYLSLSSKDVTLNSGDDAPLIIAILTVCWHLRQTALMETTIRYSRF